MIEFRKQLGIRFNLGDVHFYFFVNGFSLRRKKKKFNAVVNNKKKNRKSELTANKDDTNKDIEDPNNGHPEEMEIIESINQSLWVFYFHVMSCNTSKFMRHPFAASTQYIPRNKNRV